MSNNMKSVLITGAAQRVGARIVAKLHQENYRIIIHYHRSQQQAQALCDQLNAQRADSARCIAADLSQAAHIATLAQQIDSLDLLVNNAALFYPTPFAQASVIDWQKLFQVNTAAAFFLTQALTAQLKRTQGSVVNIIDIHAVRPLSNYSIYSATKAALAMVTKSLAQELAPSVRVNGISPGAILPPSDGNQLSSTILDKIALKKIGAPNDIADAVYFLANASYITGQILAVDGGRMLNQ